MQQVETFTNLCRRSSVQQLMGESLFVETSALRVDFDLVVFNRSARLRVLAILSNDELLLVSQLKAYPRHQPSDRVCLSMLRKPLSDFL